MKCPADATYACDKSPECQCGFCKDHCVCSLCCKVYQKIKWKDKDKMSIDYLFCSHCGLTDDEQEALE